MCGNLCLDNERQTAFGYAAMIECNICCITVVVTPEVPKSNSPAATMMTMDVMTVINITVMRMMMMMMVAVVVMIMMMMMMLLLLLMTMVMMAVTDLVVVPGFQRV